MTHGIWLFVVCAVVINKTTLALPALPGLPSEFISEDELSELDIKDSEENETPSDIDDDTIDIFSVDEIPDDTEDALPQIECSDCEVELNAEEIEVDDPNSDVTSQEEIPTEEGVQEDNEPAKGLPDETENKEIQDPVESKDKELSSEQKSKNEKILSKIETAILKSRANNDDCKNIVMSVPEFVPIFKPRCSGVLNRDVDATSNAKLQVAAPVEAYPNVPNPNVATGNNFVITGLYLKPVNDLKPNVLNVIEKGPIQSAIPTSYQVAPNPSVRTTNLNIPRPDIACGCTPANQNQIPSNVRSDIAVPIPNSYQGFVNPARPVQNQVPTLNPNQRIINEQTIPCDVSPYPQFNFRFNDPNQISFAKSHLRVDPASSVLFNSAIPSNDNLNTVITKQPTLCRDNVNQISLQNVNVRSIESVSPITLANSFIPSSALNTVPMSIQTTVCRENANQVSLQNTNFRPTAAVASPNILANSFVPSNTLNTFILNQPTSCRENIVNQMFVQNANLRSIDSVSPNLLLNSIPPSITNLNSLPNQGSYCRENVQSLNSYPNSEKIFCPPNLKFTNTNSNSANQISCPKVQIPASGEQIPNYLLTSQNSVSGNVFATNALKSAEKKPIVLFKTEKITRHELCGDCLKKKIYTVLVPV